MRRVDSHVHLKQVKLFFLLQLQLYLHLPQLFHAFMQSNLQSSSYRIIPIHLSLLMIVALTLEPHTFSFTISRYDVVPFSVTELSFFYRTMHYWTTIYCISEALKGEPKYILATSP